MQKIYLLLLLITATFSSALAQKDTLSKSDKALLDSMMKSDEFLKLLKDDAKSSLDISFGIGNGSFSTDNQAANATGVANQIIFTPSLVYHTKNGFSFGVTGFLTNDSAQKTTLYQTGISAAYDYYGKDVHTGISYTRFLSEKDKYNSKSLYQNDFYGYIKKAKGAILPGLSLGYSNGNYKEWDYASFVLKRPLNPRGDTTVIGKDSTTNKSSYFSASFSIEHDFSLYTIFSKDDELDIVPSLIVNSGSDKLNQTHTNKLFNRKAFSKFKKIDANNKFELQSVAASLDITYSIGKFFLQPNLYLDYYLPETTAKRLTAIYSVSAGLTF
jgi:hypothetical protein